MCEETVSSYGQVLTGDQHGIREKLGDLPSHQSLQIKLAQEPATIIVTITTEENLQKRTPYASSTLLIVLKRPIVVQLYQDGALRFCLSISGPKPFQPALCFLRSTIEPPRMLLMCHNDST